MELNEQNQLSNQKDQLPKFQEYRDNILSRINQGNVTKEPFYHLYIEQILPVELYDLVKAKAYYYKDQAFLKYRNQDNKEFSNPRFNLMENDDLETQYLVQLFSDPDIKWAMFQKFYAEPKRAFCDDLKIHEEFEYVYTEENRYQNIHVDIPPKFLSLVFYLPNYQYETKY